MKSSAEKELVLAPPYGGPILYREGGAILVGILSDPALGDTVRAVLWAGFFGGNQLRCQSENASGKGGLLHTQLPDWAATMERLHVLLVYAQIAAEGTERLRPEQGLNLLLSSFSRVNNCPLEEHVRKCVGDANSWQSRISAVVLPQSGPDALVFALGSCQYPAGLFDGRLAHRSYRNLTNRLLRNDGALAKPTFIVHTGDQIYSDATAGVLDSRSAAMRYARRYEDLLRNRYVRAALQRLPAYNCLDDHEVIDNWEPEARKQPCAHPGRPRKDSCRFSVGQWGDTCSFDVNCTNRQWCLKREGERHFRDLYRPGGGHALWFEFLEGGCPFFMMNSRTERERRTADSISSARFIYKSQLDALLRWLKEHGEAGKPPCFVVSPSILLPRHRIHPLRSDGWDGYPETLHAVLAAIYASRAENVVFLSGDEHRSFVARIELSEEEHPDSPVTFWSVHTSSLYAPFPFANADSSALHDSDTFPLTQAGKSITCRVTQPAERPPAGDGFAYVVVKKEANGWKVGVEFERVDGASADSHGVIVSSFSLGEETWTHRTQQDDRFGPIPDA